MPKRAYPDVPLYRYPWTALSEAAIIAQLDRAAGQAPACASGLEKGLAGTSLRIVTDDGGPALAYEFLSDSRVSFAENGGGKVEAGYGALKLDHLVLIAHIIPKSLRAYAVVIDERTDLATVFELWFGGQEAKREVSRAVWQGYRDRGQGSAPEGRHVATNRVEGKALYWKQDAGYETLEYYPSAAYSHFVELTRLDGRYGYCGPSDYVRVDEEQYIYTRTECEFSGIFTAYAMDLNRLEQIGLRLGFNGADELEYYLFRGTGEWLGQIAQFEKFGDVSGNPVPAPSKAKGDRRVYRPVQTMPKMTKAQVDAAVAKSTRIFEERSSMAGNGADPVGDLAGKSFAIHYDGGPAIEYRFESEEVLQWRKDGKGGWTSARYRAWEGMPGVYLFGHVLEGEPNHDGHMIVADLDAGLATCFNGYLNTPYFANEAGARTLRGVVKGEGIPDPGTRRHAFADELLGRAFTWNYSPGLTSMHLYSTPETVSWIIFTDDGHGGMEWSGPGDFVKIRENLFFVYWLEPACNGTLGTILINMRTMHDMGIGYHCDEKGLSLGQVGAHARHAGHFDVQRFFRKEA